MAPIPLSIPATDDPAVLADWLEMSMILRGKDRASRSWIRSTLRESAFPEDGVGTDDLDPGDLEVTVEGILAEVERRRRMAEERYPFMRENERATVRIDVEGKGLTYCFLLWISRSVPLRKKKRTAEIEKLFDYVVMDSLKAYLGQHSKGVRFGYPPSDGRPGAFAKAVEWLRLQLGLAKGAGRVRKYGGDGGVDVVVWVPFGDERAAFLVVLAQCTVESQWHNKGNDIVMDRWRGLIDFTTDPITCLAVPYIIPPGYEWWDEICRTTTLVLDRLRIVRHLDRISPAVRDQILAWTRNELAIMGEKEGSYVVRWAANQPTG